MTKFKLINGWTKEKVMEQFKKRNNGTMSMSGKLGNPSCFYRGADNNACAVGAFIPDEMYNMDMEGTAVRSLIENYPDLLCRMPLDVEGLALMQVYHDNCDSNRYSSVFTNGNTYLAIERFLNEMVE